MVVSCDLFNFIEGRLFTKSVLKFKTIVLNTKLTSQITHKKKV